MGTTISDVAAAAGVSTATVSRALRGLPHVDTDTRARVVQVARQLAYALPPSAWSGAVGRTGSIAVVTPFVSRWYFGQVLAGVESVLDRSGMDLLLFTVGDPSDEHRIPPARRLRRRVDGILVFSLPVADPQVEDLLSIDLPVSLVGATAPTVPCVSIDDIAAGRRATAHLLQLGHERIGIIGGRPSTSAFTPEHDRLIGFRRAMDAVGVEPDPMSEVFGYFTVAGGNQAMHALLALPDPPTGVFAMSDEMAFGALHALRQRGLRAGIDVAVVGIDGHDLAEIMDLTTVAQPVRELGRVAASALVQQLNAGQPAGTGPVVLPSNLVVRGSTQPDRGVARAWRPSV